GQLQTRWLTGRLQAAVSGAPPVVGTGRDRPLGAERGLDHPAGTQARGECPVPEDPAGPAQSIRTGGLVVPDQHHARHRLGGDPARHPCAVAARLRPARRAVVDRHHQERLREAPDRDLRGPGTMSAVLGFAIMFAFACVTLVLVFGTVRLLIDSSAQDRVLAIDTLWLCSMLLAIVMVIRHGSQVYFEMAMLIELVGFASTMALVKFLLRGEIVE